MKAYAGIGSRRTPSEKLKEMETLAWFLSKYYILRSGGADGADSAFANGAKAGGGPMELYLPWPGYNDLRGENVYVLPSGVIGQKAIDLARKFHPAPWRLSPAVLKLHARNALILLGKNLDDPVKFVACWGDGQGGTEQGLRMAKEYEIPILNLNYFNSGFEAQKAWVRNL